MLTFKYVEPSACQIVHLNYEGYYLEAFFNPEYNEYIIFKSDYIYAKNDERRELIRTRDYSEIKKFMKDFSIRKDTKENGK